MISWLQVLAALLKLAQLVAGIAQQRKLIEAGEAKATLQSLKETNDRVEKALAARRAAAAGGMRDDDPYRRD